MTKICSECGREDPTVYAGLCHSCLMKKSGVKPLGDAIIVPDVIEPQPQPAKTKVRELSNLTLRDKMRRRGWHE